MYHYIYILDYAYNGLRIKMRFRYFFHKGVSYLVTVNARSVQRRSTIKDVGNLFDSRLTVPDHIKMVCSTSL